MRLVGAFWVLADRYKRSGFALTVRSHPWLAIHIVLSLALAGCGGGGGDGGGAAAAAPPPQQNTPGVNVTLSGIVTFDFVPAVAGIGLDYANTRASPARGVTVELVQGASVLASTTTDAAGAYSFSVAQNTNVAVRVRAQMIRTGSPSWDFRVADNTNGDAQYVLDGTAASTGTANSTRNLHAASGWGGSGYTAARSAAPFAILDTVYDAAQFVLTANAATVFPPLVLHWSPNNNPNLSANGEPNPATGEIGTSFFAEGLGIFLLGAENADTEEYDRHVIVHEWGHYFESVFSRSDSIGGPHTRGDQLDFRVAFGEGWGNALSAMVTGQSVYRDVSGPQQSQGFAFDVEGPFRPGSINQRPGWYSEESVQEILFDLFDNSTIDVMPDGVALGFAPLYSVLVNQQRSSVPLTSIFPFITALKSDRPAEVPLIDALINTQGIDTIADPYGTTETHYGKPESADLQSVYSVLTVGGGAVNVCSIDDFSSDLTDSTNKLGSRRFLRFNVGVAGTHTITARTTFMPSGESSDPDMVLHRGAAPKAELDGAPAAECTPLGPALCTETGTVPLTQGDYVLEVYEWTNTNSHDDATYPPIGRTCFDVEVTRL